eukprot:scaffold17768_cov31-Tisochrysis_lutea.AAC.11
MEMPRDRMRSTSPCTANWPVDSMAVGTTSPKIAIWSSVVLAWAATRLNLACVCRMPTARHEQPNTSNVLERMEPSKDT